MVVDINVAKRNRVPIASTNVYRRIIFMECTADEQDCVLQNTAVQVMRSIRIFIGKSVKAPTISGRTS